MVDIVILLLLAIAILAGFYRGVVYSAISLGLSVLSFILALVLCSSLSGAFQKQESLYEMMLYYFEGYEYINETSVELVHVPAAQIGDTDLEAVILNADMPVPLDRAVKKNIKGQVYSSQGIYTLGDYFNQTIVDTVLNILSLLVLFAVIRLLLGFGLRLIDFGASGLPRLARYDAPISCGIGLLHGILLVFILWMLVPILLVVVPRLSEFIQSSPLGRFFYQSNLLLRLVPTH
ncbi:MAG: CvpA family protein [Clostridia bacterium]|nr:CvpA family protein [Clostridia bacterium]